MYLKVQEVPKVQQVPKDPRGVKGPRGTLRSERFLKFQEVPKGLKGT